MFGSHGTRVGAHLGSIFISSRGRSCMTSLKIRHEGFSPVLEEVREGPLWLVWSCGAVKASFPRCRTIDLKNTGQKYLDFSSNEREANHRPPHELQRNMRELWTLFKSTVLNCLCMLSAVERVRQTQHLDETAHLRAPLFVLRPSPEKRARSPSDSTLKMYNRIWTGRCSAALVKCYTAKAVDGLV